MRIVILGGPGSGKKTQTSLLAEKYQLTLVNSSELVKQALSEESERGMQLRLQQQAGQPMTDDVVLGLLQERLVGQDLANGFILDGFPRNLLQALTLDELLGELVLPLDFILLFEIETDALMERLVGRRTCRSCGAEYNIYTQPTAVEDVCDLCGGRLHQRADDTEDTVSSRLHVFDHLTGPMLSHYGKQGKVLRVDGEGEVEDVFVRTCKAIDRWLSQQSVAEAPAEPAPAVTTTTPIATTVDDRPRPDRPVSQRKPKQAAVKKRAKAGAKKATEGAAKAGKTAAAKPPSGKAAKKVSTKPPKQEIRAKTGVSKPKATKTVEASATKPVASKAAAKKAPPARRADKAAAPGKPGAKKTSKKAVPKKTAAKPSAAAGSRGKQAASAPKATTKTPIKKPAKKGSAAGKSKPVSTKKRVSSKAVAKKAVAKKVTAKKAVTKKAATKKVTAKKVTAKKTAAKAAARSPLSKKKTAAKATVKKPAVKKKVAKKPTTSKQAVSKKASKKTAAKKNSKRAARR